VAPRSITPWTVLLFMVVDEDALVPFALIDLRDVHRLGTVSGFNLVIEARWHNASPERLELSGGDLLPGPASPADNTSSRAAALRAFLLDALHDFPSDHYLLILWGHAYGFGFGRDADRIAFPELASVLNDFSRQRADRKLEILACNACRIGKVETAYELRHVVKYLVASQVGVPFEGWPLREVLGDLVKSPAIAPPDFASTMVTRFCDSYRRRTVTMTMLDLEGSGLVLASLERLANALLAEGDHSTEGLRSTHEAFVRAANDYEETEPVVDLLEVCSRLREASADAAVRTAAADVIETLSTSGFIAKHDGVGPGAERLHGIGLYVPHVGLDVNSNIYAKLGLVHARMWARVVDALKVSNKYAQVVEAIDVLERETLRKCKNVPSTQVGESV